MGAFCVMIWVLVTQMGPGLKNSPRCTLRCLLFCVGSYLDTQIFLHGLFFPSPWVSHCSEAGASLFSVSREGEWPFSKLLVTWPGTRQAPPSQPTTGLSAPRLCPPSIAEIPSLGPCDSRPSCIPQTLADPTGCQAPREDALRLPTTLTSLKNYLKPHYSALLLPLLPIIMIQLAHHLM